MQQQDSNNSLLDLPAIAQRARQMLFAVTVDGKEFAAKAGVPYSTMRAYMDAVRPPSSEFLAGVYRAYGFNPAWLLTGSGPMRDSEAMTRASADFVVVNMLDVHASAGNGAVNEQHAEHTFDGLAVSQEWLGKRQLSPQQLTVIQVKGASMEGVLSHGDKLLVNQADTEPKSGFVYVLRQGEELLVKYCQLLPGGVLRVSSANQLYAPYDVDLKKTPDVQILGRVVASMHEW